MNLREVNMMFSDDDGSQTFDSESAMKRNQAKILAHREKIVQNLMHGRECTDGC